MKFKLNNDSAFTMLEVLFAGTILAMATFMVLGLLKLSDEMSYRAKVDSKVSQIMKARAGVLVNASFASLVAKAATISPTSGQYQFQLGNFSTNVISDTSYLGNGTASFPFLETVDPFTTGSFNGDKYLLSGKPLPGTVDYRDIFPFKETVTLVFRDNDGPSSLSGATAVKVTYAIWWVNEFVRSTQKADSSGTVDFDKMGAIEFTFTKYDTTTY
jgi:Tfp pilus assembly protein PilV